ncbi:MAG: 3-hydroxyacyl-CoA dehydrogenase NAD-binding domain-containing protein [Myxococcota bacterium]|nr:3-hydroxyacyl-CoA dehydrogenase NAD-binding domain-containing protein [Myxococcota bacterium]
MAFSAVSIVGSGPVGCEIALACAAEEMPVVLIRGARSDVDAIRARLTRRLAIAVELGELTSAETIEILARIEIGSDLGRVDDADLVIDTTVCEPRARRAMLATLESRLSSGAVLATSASPDRLGEIAEALRRPDQLVGMRLQQLAPRDVQVELTVLPETAPGVIGAARGFCAMLRRTPLETATPPSRVGYREWLSQPASAALPDAQARRAQLPEAAE